MPLPERIDLVGGKADAWSRITLAELRAATAPMLDLSWESRSVLLEIAAASPARNICAVLLSRLNLSPTAIPGLPLDATSDLFALAREHHSLATWVLAIYARCVLPCLSSPHGLELLQAELTAAALTVAVAARGDGEMCAIISVLEASAALPEYISLELAPLSLSCECSAGAGACSYPAVAYRPSVGRRYCARCIPTAKHTNGCRCTCDGSASEPLRATPVAVGARCLQAACSEMGLLARSSTTKS